MCDDKTLDLHPGFGSLGMPYCALYGGVLPRASLKIAVIVVGLLLLSGCSSLKFGYSFADDILESRGQTYLDLSPEQETGLESQSEALVAWHRREMLPKYATFFNAQADIAETGGWTRSQLSSAFTEFRALRDETVEGAALFIAAVLIEHSVPERLAYLEARMAEKLSERRAEVMKKTSKERLDDSVERRANRFSRFVGSLSKAQTAIIRRHTEDGLDDPARWLNNRESRQKALATFLRSNPSEDEIAGFVYRILVRAHEEVDPDYRAISENRWALREAMYFDLLSSLSDSQRRELVTTLRGYAVEMVELAGV